MLADEKLKTARGVEVVLWPQTIIDLTQGSGYRAYMALS